MATTFFNIKRTLQIVESIFAKSGYFQKVGIGEPKAQPTAKTAIYIWMDRTGVATVYLDAPREIHRINIRVYKDMVTVPEERIELELSEAVSNIMNLLYSHVDAGSTIVDIDVGGIYGHPLETEWGHVRFGTGTMFRCVDVKVPFIVDTTETFKRG